LDVSSSNANAARRRQARGHLKKSPTVRRETGKE
jgi:hypothetical protein